MIYHLGLESIYGGMEVSITSMVRRFGRSRRISAPRAVIQSYKKVLNFAPASRTSGTVIAATLSLGEDSIAAGQTGTTDNGVPTGSVIKFIEIQWAIGNVSGGNNFLNVTIQLLHAGQTNISPLVVGGNPQRNPVFFQDFLPYW